MCCRTCACSTTEVSPGHHTPAPLFVSIIFNHSRNSVVNIRSDCLCYSVCCSNECLHPRRGPRRCSCPFNTIPFYRWLVFIMNGSPKSARSNQTCAPPPVPHGNQTPPSRTTGCSANSTELCLYAQARRVERWVSPRGIQSPPSCTPYSLLHWDSGGCGT